MYRCALTSLGSLVLGGRRHGGNALGLLAAGVVGIGASVPAATASQDQLQTGSDGSRELLHLGFEERATTDWSHVFEQAPGLPRRGLFFDAEVDESIRYEGRSSLRLELEGGSISYRMLHEAAMPLVLGADYRASVWIKSEGLEHAAARLEARIVDGRRLERMERLGESEDPIAECTVELLNGKVGERRGGWFQEVIDIDTGLEQYENLDVPLLFLSLQVVQPGFDDDDQTGGRISRVQVEDVQGRAWFDDVRVARTPRLRLVPKDPGGFHPLGGPVVLEATVDDPRRSVVPTLFEVRDLDGELVERRTFDVTHQRRFELDFTPPGPGWYQARLSIAGSRDARIRSSNVLVLPDHEHERSFDEPRLGVSLTGWHPDRLEKLERSLALLDPAVIEVPLWPAETDDRPSIEGLEPLRSTLDRQRFASREVMVALDRLHGGLSAVARVEPEAVLAALADDYEDIWRNALRDWMIRLGTSISRWRIAGGAWPSGSPTLIEELVADYVADPAILVSRPIDHPGGWGGDERYVTATTDLSARVMSGFSKTELQGSTVRLSLPPVGWRERDRVDEAARRVIAAWMGGASRILVPWRDESPDAALLAWTGLSPVLGGRSFEGTLHVGEGNHCIVAGDERGPVILAMTDVIDDTEVIRVPVGDGSVEVVDLGGGVREIRPRDGIVEVEVGSTPVAIFGADRLPVLVASSIRMEPSVLATEQEDHALEIVFENPVGRNLAGRIELDAPRGWSFEYSAREFTVGPHAEARIPLGLSWTRAPILGRHRISGRLQLTGGSSLEIPIHLDLDLESSLLRVAVDWSLARSNDPATAPIIVSVEVENIGDRMVDVEVTTSGWRVAREQRILTGLAPGTTRTRLMRLQAGLDRLAGTDVRVQVQELEGSGGVAVRLPIGGGIETARRSSETAVVAP